MSKKYQRRKRKKAGVLAEREREILQLIGGGLTDKKIARHLYRSFHTVHIHRKNIMAKLDIHTQAGLIRYAIKEGIAKL